MTHFQPRIRFPRRATTLGAWLLMLSTPVAGQNQEDEVSAINRLPRYISIGLSTGSFSMPDAAGQTGVQHDVPFGMIVRYTPASMPWLGGDFEVIEGGQSFDTDPRYGAPPLGTISDRTDLTVSATRVGARLGVPATVDFQAYVSGGMGLYHSKIRTSGTLLIIPGGAEQSIYDLKPYFGLGAVVRLGRVFASYDYRRFEKTATFTDFSVTPPLETGGTMHLVSVSWILSRPPSPRSDNP